MFSNILLPIVLIVEAQIKMDVNTIISYLKHTLNQSQTDEVEHWINESDENRKVVEQLYVLNFIDNRIKAFDEVDAEEMYKEFNHKYVSYSAKPQAKKRWFIAKTAGVAAIGIIFLISLFFTTLFLMDESAEPIVIATNLGERSHLTLPDGTEVWLNAFSDLAYKKSFLRRKRKVILSGEAYFEVAHNKILPFVLTDHNHTEIKVLGTKFNVRNNEDENYLAATLLEGSIQFSHTYNKQKTILRPGEELRFNKDEHTICIDSAGDPKDKISWKDGVLFFENTTLEEICISLERNFNVNIIFGDEKLKSEKFSAEFKVADNIYQILSILELTNKFELKIEDRNITILPTK